MRNTGTKNVLRRLFVLVKNGLRLKFSGRMLLRRKFPQKLLIHTFREDNRRYKETVSDHGGRPLNATTVIHLFKISSSVGLNGWSRGSIRLAHSVLRSHDHLSEFLGDPASEESHAKPTPRASILVLDDVLERFDSVEYHFIWHLPGINMLHEHSAQVGIHRPVVGRVDRDLAGLSFPAPKKVVDLQRADRVSRSKRNLELDPMPDRHVDDGTVGDLLDLHAHGRFVQLSYFGDGQFHGWKMCDDFGIDASL